MEGEVVVARGTLFGVGSYVGVHQAYGVPVVGIKAAGGTEAEHQGVFHQTLADDHIGEQTEGGSSVAGIGIPSCRETGMEHQPAEHEVGIGVHLDDVAPPDDGVGGRNHIVAQRHHAVHAVRVAVAVKLGTQVGNTLVLVFDIEAVVDIATDVEVELVLSPVGPEVAGMYVGGIAKLVGVELHVLQSNVPCGYVVRGAVVGERDAVAHRAEDRLQGAVGEAVVEVVVVFVADVCRQLQLVGDDILAEEGDGRLAKEVLVVVGNGAPREVVVQAYAVGLLAVACRAPVEVGQGRGVVAHTEAQVVVVEFGGRLTDDAGGLDARRLVD